MRARSYKTTFAFLALAMSSGLSLAQVPADLPVPADLSLPEIVVPAPTRSDASSPVKITLVVNNRPKAPTLEETLAKAEATLQEKTKEPEASPLIGGALMLCGGGPLPEAIFARFFELGQSNKGSLVIIPSASGRADAGDFAGPLSEWKSFGWSSVEIVHAKDRKSAETNASLLEPLKRATAVWISGGDQRRLAERYLGTPVEKELQSVVSRGGVVGGTSAGSAIASKVMISGGRQKPVIASGIDLLPGSIIDMHFSQRKRYERLASAVDQHPDRIGIGIDECTGLLVSSDAAEVVGSGSVYVYPRRNPEKSAVQPMRFEAGSAFKLVSTTH